jgi:recombination protein RecA
VLIEKSGSWYSFNGERIGQGRDAAMRFLTEHPETPQAIRQQLLQKAGIGVVTPLPGVVATEPASAADAQPAASEAESKPTRRRAAA